MNYFRQVYKAVSLKDQSLVALKKFRIETEKEGVSEVFMQQCLILFSFQ